MIAPRIGVAVGVDRVIAVMPQRGRTDTTAWTRPLDPFDPGSADWPALFDALTELRSQLGSAARRATLSVALLPPLADARRLDLPPLRPSERRSVVTRDASRYFPIGSEPFLVALRGVATGASEGLVTRIARVAAAAGWSVRSIVTAYAAWSARYARPRTDRRIAMRSTEGFRVDVLTLHRGRLVAVRRLSSVGDLERHAAILAGATIESHSDVLAARWAPARDAEWGALRTATEIAARSRRAVRRARHLTVIAAAACVVLAIGLRWQANRALALIEAQRASIATPVRQVMIKQAEVQAIDDRLRVLDRVARHSRWSLVMSRIGAHLPLDANLSAVRAVGDTLVLDGVAVNATDTYDAMRRVGFTSVRSLIPLRRETGVDGKTAGEHFTLGLTAR